MSSGTYRVWVPGATQYLQMVTFTCAVCNAYRNWSYEAPLGSKYTRLKNQAGPFKEISIDPLGAIITKPFPGSRKTVKTFPQLIKCINSTAVQIILMETMETKAVIMSLLRLETRYGEIQGISRDSRSNLSEENLNPKTEDGLHQLTDSLETIQKEVHPF